MMDRFETVYESLPGNGWLSKEEAAFLWSVVAWCDGDVLEVGCFEGRSTVLIARAIEPNKVHAVDSFSNFNMEDLTGVRTQDAFSLNIRSREITNVILYKQKIEDWAPIPVVLAYLDGDHTYEGTSNQIRKALICGAKSIFIHDVNDSGGGREVKRASIDHLGEWKERVGRLAWWELS